MITSLTKSIHSFLFPSYCYLCHKEGDPLCEKCEKSLKRASDTPFPWITSLYSFKDPSIKRMIHAIKYFHRKDLIFPLAQALVHEITISNKEIIIIPIPMPRLRKYIRGYNQAEEIAKIIGTKTGLMVKKNILTRKHTKVRQVKTKSRTERLYGQKNTFSLQNPVTGMSVILIDDVTTTGATLLEARKMLMENGALCVEAFTLAH